MSEEMVTICFVAPAAMKAALEERARGEDRSVSSLLRLLLDPPMDAWRRQMARNAAQTTTRPAPLTSMAGAAKVFEE